MRSFLGVPVRIRDKVFGNLYLTEKRGGATSPSRTRRSWSRSRPRPGSSIENARLYEEAARRERWLAATAEITGLLLGAGSRDDALRVVADRAREVAGADLACVVLRGPTDDLDAPDRLGCPRRRDPEVRVSTWTGRWRGRCSPPATRWWSRTWRTTHARPVTSSATPGGRCWGRRSRAAAHHQRSPGGRSPWPGRGPGAAFHESTSGCRRLRGAGGADPPGGRGARRPGAAGGLRGPRPDRARPARPGHPAALRGRAVAREHGSTGSDRPELGTGSRARSTISTPPSRTSVARSSR